MDNMDNVELLKFEGNEKEFEIYRNNLQKKFKYNSLYYDKKKKQIKYKGELLNNTYDGRGILYDSYTGKIKYNGYFKNGKYHGFGLLYEYENLIYQGFFIDGLFDGKGILYDKNKKIYNGYFKLNSYNGIGIEYFLNEKPKRKAIYSMNKISNECYGILYNKNGEEIYSGILRDGRPKEGKDLILYGDNDYPIYLGDFLNFKYNGVGIIFFENSNKIKFDGKLKDDNYVKGILYFENGNKKYEGKFKNNKYEGNGILYFEKYNKIFYEGIFIDNEYKNGILYGLKGEKIYEGEIQNSIPKEGKNIKLYKLKGFLKYEGDISNFSYNGKGKLFTGENIPIFDGTFKNGIKISGITYQNSVKKYEGEYINDKLNGYGKIYEKYYDNNELYLYYEGNFKDDNIFGEGIKYYKNGLIKIEGNFQNINSYKGTYYNPEGVIIFKGEVSNEIPFYSNNLILYNDMGKIVYNPKLYQQKINEYGFNHSTKIKKGQKKFKAIIKILLVAREMAGKTNLINVLSGGSFNESFLMTIGLDFKFISYEYQNELYQIQIFDTPSADRLFTSVEYMFKVAHIFFIVFDLSLENGIDESLFKIIDDNLKKNKCLIYLVGNKLDISNEKYLEEFRKRAKILIDIGKIDKYFEISAKTGEGIEKLSKIMKIDSAILSNSNMCKEEYYDMIENEK